VRVRARKLVKVVGKGAGLALSLGTDPPPVDVVLTAGSEHYCMSFGGSIIFRAGEKFLATDAPAPATCP
jgi:hypothetical protein